MNSEELLNELKRRMTDVTHPIDRKIFIKYSIACIKEQVSPRIYEIWEGVEGMDKRQEDLEIAFEWIKDTLEANKVENG